MSERSRNSKELKKYETPLPLKMKKKVGHISSTAPCRPLSPVKLAVARQILSTKLLFDVTF